jgi:hypothetical protein
MVNLQFHIIQPPPPRPPNTSKPEIVAMIKDYEFVKQYYDLLENNSIIESIILKNQELKEKLKKIKEAEDDPSTTPHKKILLNNLRILYTHNIELYDSIIKQNESLKSRLDGLTKQVDTVINADLSQISNQKKIMDQYKFVTNLIKNTEEMKSRTQKENAKREEEMEAKIQSIISKLKTIQSAAEYNSEKKYIDELIARLEEKEITEADSKYLLLIARLEETETQNGGSKSKKSQKNKTRKTRKHHRK